uniref:TGF_BETA_2 domain-containing protein n=1 Tax=Ascaris lumbricoides TaxID=6252 RepID=A0A0M3INM9_ASCLU
MRDNPTVNYYLGDRQNGTQHVPNVNKASAQIIPLRRSKNSAAFRLEKRMKYRTHDWYIKADINNPWTHDWYIKADINNPSLFCSCSIASTLSTAPCYNL